MKPINRLKRTSTYTALANAKAILVLSGCSRCARRLKLVDTMVFTFRRIGELPSGVLCGACVASETIDAIV